MIRKIIKIDEKKCNGCGACADACHEGAIEMVNGVAKLTKEDYCDGLGDCLPACPAGAITFEEREAPAYNEQAVLAAKKQKEQKGSTPQKEGSCPSGGCPGSRAKTIERGRPSAFFAFGGYGVSRLAQWPCQLRLVPASAPYFNGAHLLLAADCTAYAYARTHEEFMAGRITLIACPKLDPVDHSEKLAEIFKNNEISSVTLLRMEVPCCGGLQYQLMRALEKSGKQIPVQVAVVSTDGKIL